MRLPAAWWMAGVSAAGHCRQSRHKCAFGLRFSHDAWLLAVCAHPLTRPPTLTACVQAAGADGEAERRRLQQLSGELDEARRREQVN